MISVGISTMLLVTAGLNCLLMLLMATAQRARPMHGWFALLTGSAAVWAVAINGFLTTPADNPVGAVAWVHIYYVAGVGIIYGLFEFCLQFPRVVKVPTTYRMAAAAIAVTMAFIAVMSDGLVRDVALAGAGWTVDLNPVYYFAYTAMYLILITASIVAFARGVREARRHHRRRLSRTLLSIGLGTGISLACGVWFNLLLPLLGRYDLIWAGPPCAIIFAIVALVAIVRQGILDLRQAVARSMVYIVFVAAVVVVYSVIVFSVLQLFSPLITNVSGRTVLLTLTAVLLAFAIQPVWRRFDRVMGRVFYRDSYNIDEVTERLREVTTNEVQSRILSKKVTKILSDVLQVRYVNLYIYNSEEVHSTHSAVKSTAYQQRYQDEYAHVLPESLPILIDHVMFREANDSRRAWLVEEGKIDAAVQLKVRGQRVGLLLIGLRLDGKHLSPKDIKLLTMIDDELALAVQNTLRFQEIEAFNDTLRQRVTEATKELRRSNKELQKLDEAKDEFVSMASHQLRTPLTSVKGYIDMVLQGDAGKITPMQRQLLSEAFTSSERMVHLINDFLNVSRLQTGKFMLDRRPVELAKLVGQEVESLRTTAAARTLELRYRAPARIPVLYLDADKLRQVIMNFIDNAIYYSREDSAITVKLRVDQGDVVLEVHDTGIGVPKDEQAHLFTKFFRAGNARKQRPDGTGVGLYLAKKVITEHGGSMVFSSVEGEGSVFGFRLPVKRLQTAPAQDADELNN